MKIGKSNILMFTTKLNFVFEILKDVDHNLSHVSGFKNFLISNSSCLFSVIVAEPTELCKDGEFRCGDSDQCIPYSKVCDAHFDCSNKMDEPMSCGELFFS